MNNLSPKISVILPFYNTKPYLKEALESILNQSFSDFELIIINDASTDDSEEIVKNYLNDPRIIYLKNKTNQGIVHNLNLGLKISRAEIIARMDGDDVSLPNRLAKQYEYLTKNPKISAVGTFIRMIDEKNQAIDFRTKPIQPEEIKKNLINYSPIVHATAMYRKADVLAVGGYQPEWIYVEDIDLWYRLIYRGYLVSNISEFLLLYRYHANSTAHQGKALAKKAFRLRRWAIKEFNLKLDLRQLVLIYSQLLAGLLFSGRQRQYLEGLFKKIIYHGK